MLGFVTLTVALELPLILALLARYTNIMEIGLNIIVLLLLCGVCMCPSGSLEMVFSGGPVWHGSGATHGAVSGCPLPAAAHINNAAPGSTHNTPTRRPHNRRVAAL